jgi:hypothetical protein
MGEGKSGEEDGLTSFIGSPVKRNEGEASSTQHRSLDLETLEAPDQVETGGREGAWKTVTRVKRGPANQ